MDLFKLKRPVPQKGTILINGKTGQEMKYEDKNYIYKNELPTIEDPIEEDMRNLDTLKPYFSQRIFYVYIPAEATKTKFEKEYGFNVVPKVNGIPSKDLIKPENNIILAGLTTLEIIKVFKRGSRVTLKNRSDLKPLHEEVKNFLETYEELSNSYNKIYLSTDAAEYVKEFFMFVYESGEEIIDFVPETERAKLKFDLGLNLFNVTENISGLERPKFEEVNLDDLVVYERKT